MPQVERLPIDESTLLGITVLRIDFLNVSDTDATTLELHVLGCIKGTSLHFFLPNDRTRNCFSAHFPFSTNVTD